LGDLTLGRFSNLYYEVAEGDQEILLLYVDDLFGTGEGKLILDSKGKLVTEFELEYLSIMYNFLGLEVWQKPRGIILSQGKYAVEILKRFGTMDWESMTTLMMMDLFLVILHMGELMPTYSGN
jgi:hypothetical protein